MQGKSDQIRHFCDSLKRCSFKYRMHSGHFESIILNILNISLTGSFLFP